MSNLLEMKGISKSFNGVTALKEVELTLQGGQVHALLGANGAGKSTLMKILAGAYRYDRGSIRINGDECNISSPEHAARHGIHIVYQEVDTAIIPTLSVYENIMLSSITHSKKVFVNRSSYVKKAKELAEQVGLQASLFQDAIRLTLAQKQLVLIARALSQQARFIILDEPTAPLSQSESDKLYGIIEKLKMQGVGIVFISHRLEEVFKISDTITVMRDGRHIVTCSRTQTTVKQVIQAMLGKELSHLTKREQLAQGEQLLKVENLQSNKIKGFSLALHRGEVIGIFGMVGAGKSEAARLIFQADQRFAGDIILQEKRLTKQTTLETTRHKIALIPEERRKEGLVIGESIRLNMTLPSLVKWSRLSFINSKQEHAQASAIRQQLNIKAQEVNHPVKNLSGGNQQKVVIGKWLLADSTIYLFDEPTKGIDVGAKQEVLQLIDTLARQGKGILYFSSELDETMAVADRVYVMFEGRVVKELNRFELTGEKLLYYASGGQESGE